MVTEELREVRVMLNLSGISRREAARALHLSYSALNRKLCGTRGLRQEEKERLYKLAKERRGTTL